MTEIVEGGPLYKAPVPEDIDPHRQARSNNVVTPF